MLMFELEPAERLGGGKLLISLWMRCERWYQEAQQRFCFSPDPAVLPTFCPVLCRRLPAAENRTCNEALQPGRAGPGAAHNAVNH